MTDTFTMGDRLHPAKRLGLTGLVDFHLPELEAVVAPEKIPEVSPEYITLDKSSSELTVSAYHGDCDKITKLLKDGKAHINLQDNLGRTALMAAAYQGHIKVVQLLLAAGADVRMKTHSGKSALFYAVMERHGEIVERLVNHCPDLLTDGDEQGRTVLFICALNRRCEMLELLHSLGADLSAQDHMGRTPLMAASQEGHGHIVRYLFDHITSDSLGMRSHNGECALDFAVANNKVGCLKLLLDKTEMIDMLDINWDTPLIKAVAVGNLETVGLLANAPENINHLNKHNRTALMVASVINRIDVVECLINMGADLNLRSENGLTVLFLARALGYEQVLRVLIKAGAVDQLSGYSKNVAALLLAASLPEPHLLLDMIQEGADVNIYSENGLSALMVAAQNGLVQNVRCLIEQNAKINHRTKDGITALTYAIDGQNLEIIDLLLGSDADLNMQNEDNNSLLYIAAEEGNLLAVQNLVHLGADVNQFNNNNRTALMAAASNGSKGIVEYLLKVNADSQFKCSEGMDAIQHAFVGNHETVRELLQIHQDNVDEFHPSGHRLVIASLHRDIKEVRNLLKRGVPVDFPDKVNRRSTPLIVACIKGQYEVAQLLIEYGANVNKADDHAHTPVFLAATQNYFQILKLLIIHGGIVNRVKRDGRSPLMGAAASGNMDAVKYLIENGALVNARDSKGNTALTCAVGTGNLDIIQYLLEKKCKVDCVDVDNVTPLIMAALSGHIVIVQILVQYNADLNHTDYQGRTALMAATQENHLNVVKYLVESGADINIMARPGYTVKDIALQIGMMEIYEYLVGLGPSGSKEAVDRIINSDDIQKAVQFYKKLKGINSDDYVIGSIKEIDSFHMTGHTTMSDHIPDSVACRNTDVAKYLIEMGADIYTSNLYREQVLAEITICGDLDILSSAFQRVRYCDEHVSKVIQLAIIQANRDIIDSLLHHSSIDFNDIILENGESILFLTINLNSVTLTSKLLEHELDVNQPNDDGRTCLMSACTQGFVELVICLLDNYADLSMVDNYGEDAMSLALTSGQYETAQHLLEVMSAFTMNIDTENGYLIVTEPLLPITEEDYTGDYTEDDYTEGDYTEGDYTEDDLTKYDIQDHCKDYTKNDTEGHSDYHTLTQDHTQVHIEDHTQSHTQDYSENHSKDHSQDHSKDHTQDHSKDHTQDHSKNHTQDHSKDHTQDHSMDHTQDHTQDHSKDHTQDHSKDHTQDHSKDHTQDHSKDHTQDHSKDHTQDHSKNHTQDHSKDHTQDHSKNHIEDHKQDHIKDHIDRTQYHTEDHTQDHAEDHTQDHAEDHAQDHTQVHIEDHTQSQAQYYTQDHTQNHVKNHIEDHSKNHTHDHTQDHIEDHIKDHTQYHTEDHIQDPNDDHTQNQTKGDHTQSHTDQTNDLTQDYTEGHIHDYTEDHTQDHTKDQTQDDKQDHTLDNTEDHTNDHTHDHAQDYTEVHTQVNTHAEDHTQNHTEDLTQNHAEDLTQNHTEDLTQNHAEDLTQNHTEDLTQNHAEDLTQNHAEDLTQNHTEDLTQNHAEDLTQNHAEDLTQNHAEDLTQNHTEDLTQNHTEYLTQNHAEDLTQNHAEDLTQNHTENLTQNHAEDLTQSHTQDLTQNHAEDHTHNHTEDLTQSHTEDHTHHTEDDTKDNAQDHTQDPMEDHTEDHTEVNTQDHTEDHTQDHTQDHRHTQNHPQDHLQNHDQGYTQAVCPQEDGPRSDLQKYFTAVYTKVTTLLTNCCPDKIQGYSRNWDTKYPVIYIHITSPDIQPQVHEYIQANISPYSPLIQIEYIVQPTLDPNSNNLKPKPGAVIAMAEKNGSTSEMGRPFCALGCFIKHNINTGRCELFVDVDVEGKGIVWGVTVGHTFLHSENFNKRINNDSNVLSSTDIYGPVKFCINNDLNILSTNNQVNREDEIISESVNVISSSCYAAVDVIDEDDGPKLVDIAMFPISNKYHGQNKSETGHIISHTPSEKETELIDNLSKTTPQFSSGRFNCFNNGHNLSVFQQPDIYLAGKSVCKTGYISGYTEGEIIDAGIGMKWNDTTGRGKTARILPGTFVVVNKQGSNVWFAEKGESGVLVYDSGTGDALGLVVAVHEHYVSPVCNHTYHKVAYCMRLSAGLTYIQREWKQELRFGQLGDDRELHRKPPKDILTSVQGQLNDMNVCHLDLISQLETDNHVIQEILEEYSRYVSEKERVQNERISSLMVELTMKEKALKEMEKRLEAELVHPKHQLNGENFTSKQQVELLSKTAHMKETELYEKDCLLAEKELEIEALKQQLDQKRNKFESGTLDQDTLVRSASHASDEDDNPSEPKMLQSLHPVLDGQNTSLKSNTIIGNGSGWGYHTGVPNKDLKADTGAKPNKDLKADTGANPNKDLKADTGANPNKDLKADTGVNPNKALKADTSVNPNKDLKTDTSVNPNEDLKADTGVNPNEDLKADTGVNPNKDLKADTGVNPNKDLKADTGVSPNKDLIADTGVNPNKDLKADTSVNPNKDLKADTGVNPNKDLKADTGVNPNKDNKADTGVNPVESDLLKLRHPILDDHMDIKRKGIAKKDRVSEVNDVIPENRNFPNTGSNKLNGSPEQYKQSGFLEANIYGKVGFGTLPTEVSYVCQDATPIEVSNQFQGDISTGGSSKKEDAAYLNEGANYDQNESVMAEWESPLEDTQEPLEVKYGETSLKNKTKEVGWQLPEESPDEEPSSLESDKCTEDETVEKPQEKTMSGIAFLEKHFNLKKRGQGSKKKKTKAYINIYNYPPKAVYFFPVTVCDSYGYLFPLKACGMVTLLYAYKYKKEPTSLFNNVVNSDITDKINDQIIEAISEGNQAYQDYSNNENVLPEISDVMLMAHNLNMQIVNELEFESDHIGIVSDYVVQLKYNQILLLLRPYPYKVVSIFICDNMRSIQMFDSQVHPLKAADGITRLSGAILYYSCNAHIGISKLLEDYSRYSFPLEGKCKFAIIEMN